MINDKPIQRLKNFFTETIPCEVYIIAVILIISTCLLVFVTMIGNSLRYSREYYVPDPEELITTGEQRYIQISPKDVRGTGGDHEISYVYKGKTYRTPNYILVDK